MEHQEHVIERYERAWIFFGLAMITAFIILVGYLMLTMGNTNPVSVGRIDPTKVRTEGDFANPRVEQVGNEYVAYIQAFSFGYLPTEMRFKAGRRVTFYITSPDVQHGFQVENTNINVQVIPGEIAKVSYTFTRPGTYRIICNEYCGIGHASMLSQLIVEP
ncbi:cytochrome C oxidase subunit II [Meiothermus sp. QL-1]|uniref:cytochrome c oxidase subunit II n=1 Tax=Meiothermus sp. QL-1 TaxID=2058095 RepID=UPI000E0A4765|nr:cytochrome c oxidase subunit II [Meiothermus sp. QL-1]RDI95585.1 cytochrome C oxidase subunit II [Meiothermus sp. QL-1]